jgi:hypothetical protein
MTLFIRNYGSPLCQQVLFHPNSGSGEDGEIGAVRLGSYKVVYYTGMFYCKLCEKYDPFRERGFLTLKA